MASYNPRRSQQEWLQLITECRQSGMADNAWCERHNISLAAFIMRLPDSGRKPVLFQIQLHNLTTCIPWTLLHTRMWSGLA